MVEIQKKYDPKQVETKWYEFWEENGLFKVDPKSGRDPFCIIMPPPNVTGQLHMGHALQDTIQDMLIRLKKMQGFEAHWQPGKDHAGIATQNVVEKQLAEEGTTRHKLGREDFIKRVWEWKEKFGNRIFEQKRLLGDSADWSRERFTLDDETSKTVSKVFKGLYDKGLIYRGKYIVNWCPRCHTAISDEEVTHKEKNGHLWYFKYPLKPVNPDDKKEKIEYITVATTRPETMLGDAAIAVNPADEKLKHLKGRYAILPLLGQFEEGKKSLICPNCGSAHTNGHGLKRGIPYRKCLDCKKQFKSVKVIPIIEDDFVDPEFGTGQVKVTPAHDPNDFQMARRNKIKDFTVVMDENAVMNGNAGEFAGMDRFEARKAVIKKMDEYGLLVKTEEYTNSIGYCQRCSTVIEPYLSDQWFVKMEPLAEPAIKTVKDGRINFYPARWSKIYFAWMENIRDWCISRQLWWGHRIPVWYCNQCNEVIVSIEPPNECPKCKSIYLRQDDDVLDTWFSSWLWAFSSLGWTGDSVKIKQRIDSKRLTKIKKTKEPDDFNFWYPSNVLVTGYDIIFFWVARMIMAGLEFTGDIPFKDVYITGMIKDEQGRWMSKSLGNGIDPAEMVEQYGADAVRFTLISLATEGQDIKLSPSRFEGGRNFANKLWNSYRFLMSKAEQFNPPINVENAFTLDDDALLPDRWIVSRLHAVTVKVTENADRYRVNDMIMALYEFVWKEYCDWYLELIKVRLHPKAPDHIRRGAITLALAVFESVLRLLHPAIPFITEEMWQGMQQYFGNGLTTNDDIPKVSITSKEYPKAEQFTDDPDAEKEMDYLQRLIGAVRNIRSEMRVPPDKTAELHITKSEPQHAKLIEANIDEIFELTNSHYILLDGQAPKRSGSAVVDTTEIFVPLGGLIDLDVERYRLDKEIKRLEGLIQGAEAKLANDKFIERAPKEVIQHEKDKLLDCQTQLVTVFRNRAALD